MLENPEKIDISEIANCVRKIKNVNHFEQYLVSDFLDLKKSDLNQLKLSKENFQINETI